MAKLAFISDVHSNLEALEAALKDIGETETCCLGDIVGYGGSPNEVVRIVEERGVKSVLGNHDYAVLTGDVGSFNARAMQAVTWTSMVLDERSRRFLAGLPRSRTFEVGGVKVYMAHGSPDDNLWEYVHPTTHSGLFGYYLKKLGVDVIALGHTHLPFVWSGAEGTVFNPGSVGQPRTGDPRASYALLAIEEARVSVELRSVEYDVNSAARKILAVGLPRALASRLYSGE